MSGQEVEAIQDQQRGANWGYGQQNLPRCFTCASQAGRIGIALGSPWPAPAGRRPGQRARCSLSSCSCSQGCRPHVALRSDLGAGHPEVEGHRPIFGERPQFSAPGQGLPRVP